MIECMKKFDVVIIGGGPAAIVTGMTVKKFFKTKEVLMIKEEADGLVPCGIPNVFHLLSNDADKNKMGPKPFVDLGGEVVINTAKTVDKIKKTVTVKTGEQYEYAKLVFTTGSLPQVPDFIPGHDLQNVFYVKKNFLYIKELASKIKSFKKIVIVGGGFIGAEVAEQIAVSGVN